MHLRSDLVMSDYRVTYSDHEQFGEGDGNSGARRGTGCVTCAGCGLAKRTNTVTSVGSALARMVVPMSTVPSVKDVSSLPTRTVPSVVGVNYLHISVGMMGRLTGELSRMEPRKLLMTELFLKREKAEKGTGTRGARFLRSLNIVRQARVELGQSGNIFSFILQAASKFWLCCF